MRAQLADSVKENKRLRGGIFSMCSNLPLRNSARKVTDRVMSVGMLSEFIAIAGLGVANLLITEEESSAELDGSSLPPLVVEGKILVLSSFRYKSQVTQRIELCSPTTAPENCLDNPQV